MKKIGFLGCGRIAEPMVVSLVRRFPDARIFVSTRSEDISHSLDSRFTNVQAGENQWVVDQADTVVLSVLAQVARKVLPALQFQPRQSIISVMADISLAEVQSLTAPADPPCVTIPLPFIDGGGCPLPVFPRSPMLEELFGDENTVITVEKESHMGPHFAATALLSTLMAQMDTATDWLGTKTGDRKQAEVYVATLVGGYLGSLPKDGQERFREALYDLSTEGGLNTQLLTHNRSHGMTEFLYEGFVQLGRRLEQTS